MRLDRDPFTGEGNEALLAALGDATEAVERCSVSRSTGLNAWTDAALMQAAGIPTVLFGPDRRQLPRRRRVGVDPRRRRDRRDLRGSWSRCWRRAFCRR